MEVDETFTEEEFLSHRETSFELEHQGQRRRGRLKRRCRTIQDEAEIVGRASRGVKPTAGNKVCWHGFIQALCSYVE
jgi:hypothetical protein